MRAKVLKFVLTPVIVDEDDAGEIIGQVPAEITPEWEFIGRHSLERALKAKLAELDDLLQQRTANLNATKPNRAARRSDKRGGR